VSHWWRDAVFYEIYVRSFADGNGDGVGDLPGVTSRLDYVSGLGVDGIWLTPFYPSPMADGGYDIADYRGVDPLFGSLADFDELLARAHRLGLRVIIDLVPNHTSTQHPWFVAAVAAGAGSQERDRYIFRRGRGETGEVPPNNWPSRFGGPAWSRVVEPDGRPGEWYLHLFAPEQPDLNWRNPAVRTDFEQVLRFWLDRGVDGFRVDVAMGLFKADGLVDVDAGFSHFPANGYLGRSPIWNQPEVHDVYRHWREILDSYPGDRIAVGETFAESPENLAEYVRPDELHQSFNFAWLRAPWSATAFRNVVDSSLHITGLVGAPTTWVLSNHDAPRHRSRYGPGQVGLRRARAAILAMLALPGSAYLYQGEELGLADVTDLPDDALQDPMWERSGRTNRGRDGRRVPIPWSGTQPPYGFAPNGVPPWLPIPPTWAALTVEAQSADNRSTLFLYRRALRIRRDHPALGVGEMQWLEATDQVLALTRAPGFSCFLNCGDAPVPLPPHRQVLLASGPLTGERLPADTAAWLDTS
jgi:alpha-glucosidase